MITPTRSQRKLWVCEAGSTATSVPVQPGELVDDVKTLVLNRYANSLGKALDAAHVDLTITPRIRGPPSCHERFLSPDEDVHQLLDAYYPGGQNLIEALIISSSSRPKRRPSTDTTQRSVPSRAPAEWVPLQSSSDPATPVRGPTIREIQATPQAGSSRKQMQNSNLVRSVSAGNADTGLKVDSAKFERSARDLFNTGRVSPRPQFVRRDSSPSEDASSRRPLNRRSQNGQRSLRPSPEDRKTSSHFTRGAALPAQASRPSSRTGRPSLGNPDGRPKTGTSGEKPPRQKSKQKAPKAKPLVQLEGAIPPINVLIAEDNSLVSRVVSKQMQQLNVRWDTASNGREAVEKWKAGKFHLIFMDIGMPVMDGLEATQEIRRLERGETEDGAETAQQRAPVIVVALTASSLPSDRDSALNAGCNDFITKPLEQAWLGQKVKEWGCMQALIDYEEWRIWKGYQIREATA